MIIHLLTASENIDCFNICSFPHAYLFHLNFLFDLRRNIPDFVDEVERRINEHCPFYASQVEAFLENYLCQSSEKLMAENSFSIYT